jgi:hypothetical protein
MWEHLQPLQSSLSSESSDGRNAAELPTYEQFTTPRSTPPSGRNSTSARRPSIGSQAFDLVKAHTRKISNSLTKPPGYQPVKGRAAREGSQYELRALMDPSRTQVVDGRGKSGESYSVAGSEEGRDSASSGLKVWFMRATSLSCPRCTDGEGQKKVFWRALMIEQAM